MHVALQLHCGDGGGDRDRDDPWLPGADPDASPAELDDLAYRVEVWDAGATYAEALVAVAASPAVAYAAYYAAAREHPGRDVTLTHKGMILSHWRAGAI